MITEVEAYRGEYDLASHASKGKTARTKIMYDESGRAYIYMIYGMYFMLNVVTEEKNFPAAVLIRGVEINGKKINGPGKLTKFFHIDKSLNSYDLTKGKKLWIEFGHPMSKRKITKSPRVGIEYSRHCKKWQWNFRIANLC